MLYWYRAAKVAGGLVRAKKPGRVSDLSRRLMQHFIGKTDEALRQETWALALERYARFKNSNPYPEYERDVDWVFEQVKDL